MRRGGRPQLSHQATTPACVLCVCVCPECVITCSCQSERPASQLQPPHLCQVALGEHKAHVADQLIQDWLPLVVTSLLDVEADGALHHGVLAHEDDGLRAQGLGVDWEGRGGERVVSVGPLLPLLRPLVCCCCCFCGGMAAVMESCGGLLMLRVCRGRCCHAHTSALPQRCGYRCCVCCDLATPIIAYAPRGCRRTAWSPHCLHPQRRHARRCSGTHRGGCGTPPSSQSLQGKACVRGRACKFSVCTCTASAARHRRHSHLDCCCCRTQPAQRPAGGFNLRQARKRAILLHVVGLEAGRRAALV